MNICLIIEIIKSTKLYRKFWFVLVVLSPYICLMTNRDKNTIWNILSKYDNTLTSMCDSLSNILQEKSEKTDYINVFRNYRKMDFEDTKIVDLVLGDKILMSIN